MKSGQRVDASRLDFTQINLQDIAHHLTSINRFGGALPLDQHYSVAQHSILLAKYAYEKGQVEAARGCLMHDATEAYLGDILGPLKPLLSDYLKIENELMALIVDKYKLNMLEIVTVYDKCILLDEALAFFPDRYQDFVGQKSSYTGRNLEPLGVTPQNDISNLAQVRQLFLYWCHKLGIKD